MHGVPNDHRRFRLVVRTKDFKEVILDHRLDLVWSDSFKPQNYENANCYRNLNRAEVGYLKLNWVLPNHDEVFNHRRELLPKLPN